jgi:type IV pilus assembly protein PilO
MFQPIYDEKKKLEAKLIELGGNIAKKQLIVQEVEKNKKQLIQLNEDLKIALTKLPDQKEIPGLLSSLSEAGKNSGLEFVLFEPVQPVNKEFYAEIPVKMTVNGGFHNTASFFEKVARLPRIVNISDGSISTGKESKEDNYFLTTSCQIKTYMFVEKTEADSKQKKDEKKKDAKKL